MPNFRMPAEWEPQAAVWLAWPHNKEDWPGRFGPIPWVYAEIIRNIAPVERVRLVMKNQRQQAEATTILQRVGVDLNQIDFITAPTDRVWLRDSGPTFIHDGDRRIALDWRFNAWAKYDDWRRDDKIPVHAANFLGIDRIQPTHNGKRVVLEGGSIDVNGQGTLLTTEECLQSDIQCRNPGFTKADYEQIFHDYLGVTHTIWLTEGIAGDDTHGHVDDLARFIAPDTVVLATEPNPHRENHTRLKDNYRRLAEARNHDGKQLTIVELPLPAPIVFDGQTLPASYANFLIVNERVIVPVFNDPNDRVALGVLAECMAGREVVPVYCGDFIWGLGAVHCGSKDEVIATEQ